MTFMALLKRNILKILGILAILIPPIVFAINITVPSAPGAGYFLYSTTTGAYVYHSSSTAATDFGITSSQWTTGASSSIYYNLGNVGIGTSSPATTLDVNGSSTFRGNIYTPALGSSGCIVLTTGGLHTTSTCITSNSGDWAGTWQTYSPSYFQTALGFTPLNPANNLSELTSTSTARTNIGLGSAATQNTSYFQTNLNGAYVSSLNGATGTATYSVSCTSGCTATTSTTSTAITVTGASGTPGYTRVIAMATATATSSITISNLNIISDGGMYHIIVNLTGTASGDIRVTLNNDNGGNYDFNRGQGGSFVNSTNNTYLDTTGGISTSFGEEFMDIYQASSTMPIGRWYAATGVTNSFSVPSVLEGNFMWNSTSTITSITFLNSGGATNWAVYIMKPTP